MRNQFLILLLWILLTIPCLGQSTADFKAKMLKVNEKLQFSNYSLSVNYLLYDKVSVGKPYQSTVMKYYKYDYMLKQESEMATQFSNDKFRLIVYKKGRQAILNNPQPRKFQSRFTSSELMQILDSTESLITGVISSGDSAFGNVVYSVNLQKGVLPYDRYLIKLDTTDNSLREIVLYYSGSLAQTLNNPVPASDLEKDFIPVLVIRFGKMEPLDEKNIPEFYAQDILIKEKRKYKLSSAYSNYQLQDFTSK